ncbi:MAG: hypothetical protein JNK23_11245 [Opitutaceae bacterium]|nr:hypothetical protein [Opitutaceae bacterium]
MTDWTTLPEFDGVDLSESYVLGWQIASSDLIFQLDVALVPGHPRYQTPRENDRACWLSGRLHFPNARDVVGLHSQGEVPGAIDATGTRDFGNIDGISWSDGRAHVVGEFGDVTLVSARPFITFWRLNEGIA